MTTETNKPATGSGPPAVKSAGDQVLRAPTGELRRFGKVKQPGKPGGLRSGARPRFTREW